MEDREDVLTFERQVEQLAENYFQLTRHRTEGFVCPITLEEVSLDRVCAGHILNDALGLASRKKVPQFKDIDHYYGRTIEPELIDFLNFPAAGTADRLKKHKRFFITLDGKRYEAFSAGPEAGKCFPKVDIIDSDGKVIDERYIRPAQIAPGHHSDVESEFFLTVHNFALIGALIKSAYLAMFKMVGYRYGLHDAVGATVRRALAGFYSQRATAADARKYFSEFEGALLVSLGGALDQIPDTLQGGWMLMHYAEGNARTGLLFASSCLFRVNSITLIVTIPAYSRDGYSLDAISYYRKLLADRTLEHSIHLTQFKDETFEISQKPLEMQYLSEAQTNG